MAANYARTPTTKESRPDMNRFLAFICLTGLGCLPVSAAETKPAASPPKIFRDHVEPHWFAIAHGETNNFWYRLELPQGRREFIRVDAASGLLRVKVLLPNPEGRIKAGLRAEVQLKE